MSFCPQFRLSPLPITAESPPKASQEVKIKVQLSRSIRVRSIEDAHKTHMGALLTLEPHPPAHAFGVFRVATVGVSSFTEPRSFSFESRFRTTRGSTLVS